MDPVEVIGPLIGFGLLVLVPLTAMLLNHQRKMAELIHRRPQDDGLRDQVAALSREVQTLRHELHQQIIAAEDVRGLVARATTPPPVPSETDVTSRLQG